MERIECNVATGDVSMVTLSPEEEAEAQARAAAWATENTQDARAARSVDARDRLNFEVDFAQENRLRVLEGKSVITRVQYRDALLAEWKRLNP